MLLLAINGLDGIGKGNAVGCFQLTDLKSCGQRKKRKITPSDLSTDATDTTSTCDNEDDDEDTEITLIQQRKNDIEGWKKLQKGPLQYVCMGYGISHRGNKNCFFKGVYRIHYK